MQQTTAEGWRLYREGVTFYLASPDLSISETYPVAEIEGIALRLTALNDDGVLPDDSLLDLLQIQQRELATLRQEVLIEEAVTESFLCANLPNESDIEREGVMLRICTGELCKSPLAKSLNRPPRAQIFWKAPQQRAMLTSSVFATKTMGLLTVEALKSNPNFPASLLGKLHVIKRQIEESELS